MLAVACYKLPVVSCEALPLKFDIRCELFVHGLLKQRFSHLVSGKKTLSWVLLRTTGNNYRTKAIAQRSLTGKKEN